MNFFFDNLLFCDGNNTENVDLQEFYEPFREKNCFSMIFWPILKSFVHGKF